MSEHIEITPELIAIRHYLHEHPERSFKETSTTAYLADQLRAHGIEAIADAVVLAIRNRTDTGFCPMESAVWDISDPCEAKAALERRISEMMAKK